MKTLQQEIDSATEAHINKISDLSKKHKVLALLPDLGEYAPPSIHAYPLYGSVGSINFRIQRYASIAEGKSPDVALLRSLLAQFVPVPILKRKDGCTSFIPEPESFTNNGEYTDVAPILVEIDPSQHSQTITVKWYATLETGDLWRFEVEFPLYMQHQLGKLDLRYVRMFGRGEITRVEHCDFTPANGAKRVRWASGDHKTPNHFTLYWERGSNVNVPDLLSKEVTHSA